MNARSLIVWGVTLVAIVGVFTFEKVDGQREYERGYEDAMKEAHALGLAEKLSHSKHGTVYSFLPKQ